MKIWGKKTPGRVSKCKGPGASWTRMEDRGADGAGKAAGTSRAGRRELFLFAPALPDRLRSLLESRAAPMPRLAPLSAVSGPWPWVGPASSSLSLPSGVQEAGWGGAGLAAPFRNALNGAPAPPAKRCAQVLAPQGTCACVTLFGKGVCAAVIKVRILG